MPGGTAKPSVSVVVPARNESANIENVIKRLPAMGPDDELIFVEGHSKDGTQEEIKRVMEEYPEEDIKLLVQDGFGQGDAFRKGFDNAKGDFIFWLEADLTTPPEDLLKFWDAYSCGRCEYANGTRLVAALSIN